MKHFNVLVILFLTIFLWNSRAIADDQITCTQEINNNVEIFALLATVKNDILGTLPQFCRPEGYKQLSDQVDPGEKALSDFVDNLKKFNPDTPDTISINTEDEQETTNTIFDTLKIVILKKMWQQSSSDNQYSLLVSSECGSLGLNRFPIYSATAKAEEIKEKNKEEALKKTFGVCQSTEFSELAPFISKDVLAETLLNLKNVFPHSFPEMVESLCADLSETDELIFKDDKYDDFSRGQLKIDSAKGFTAWLKSIYTDVSNKEANDKKDQEAAAAIAAAEQKMMEEQEKAYQEQEKKQQEEMAKLAEEKKTNKEKIKQEDEEASDEEPLTDGSYQNYEEYNAAMQKLYKYVFNKYAKDGQSGLITGESGKFKEYNGYIVFKDAKGKLQFKPGPEMLAKQKEQEAASLAEYKKQEKESYDNYVKASIESKTKDIKAIYEKAQSQNPGKPVEDPNTMGFYIEKDANGDFYYKPTAETIAKAEALNTKLEKQIKSKEYQEFYKDAYEKMQSSGKEEIAKVSYGLSKIIKDKDGFYIPVPDENNIESESFKKIALKLTGPTGTISPAPDNGLAFIKTSSGKYVQHQLIDQINVSAGNNDYQTNQVQVKDVSLSLNSYIVKKYQGKTADSSNIKKLNEKEIIALKSYTGSGYQELNTCLRKESCDKDQDKKVKDIVSGLQKIKSENWNKGIENTSPNNYQIVYRGTSNLPDFVQEALNKESDSFVLDKGFMSTTGEIATARNFSGGGSANNQLASGQAIFIMKTKSCVGISTISSFGSAEDEFLCPPGMKFKARQKKDSPGYYILEELDK